MTESERHFVLFKIGQCQEHIREAEEVIAQCDAGTYEGGDPWLAKRQAKNTREHYTRRLKFHEDTLNEDSQ